MNIEEFTINVEFSYPLLSDPVTIKFLLGDEILYSKIMEQKDISILDRLFLSVDDYKCHINVK